MCYSLSVDLFWVIQGWTGGSSKEGYSFSVAESAHNRDRAPAHACSSCTHPPCICPMKILVESERQPVLRDGLTAAGTQTGRLQVVALGGSTLRFLEDTVDRVCAPVETDLLGNPRKTERIAVAELGIWVMPFSSHGFRF